MKIPTNFEELGTEVLPNLTWPSDHICLSAVFNLKVTKEEEEEKKTAAAHSTDPTIRCGCGCVPPILSLFEMAELRKKLKEKKERNT